MARQLEIYPKASIDGSNWTYVVKVADPSIGGQTKFTHFVPAGVTSETPLLLLKLVIGLTVADTVTDGDVDAAFFTDRASGGPTNGLTLFGAWTALAEPKIAGLPSGYTMRDFWSVWSAQDTARIRTAARRILINGRGWSVTGVHQHEGDGTVLTE